MYHLVLTTIVLVNNQIASQSTVIPDPYKSYQECMEVAKFAQDYVNKVAKESNTVPGRVSCKLEGV